jgi:hypothetical protein
MKQENIKEYLDYYLSETNPTDRYTSFDYCYNYFKTNSSEYILNNMEKSCLVLGFYLASWGMLRNSFLLQKSIKFYEPIIKYIAELDRSYWSIDVDNYTDDNINKILKVYEDLKSKIIPKNKKGKLAKAETLLTKILLGVFGFIPAFDSNFLKASESMSKENEGFTAVNIKNLKKISEFYVSNKTVLDEFASTTKTYDFATGEKTKISYTKAKIIDMYGFMVGLKLK